MDIKLDLNLLINQLCEANCTNGEMNAEIERLTERCETLTKENDDLRTELSALKEELADTKFFKDLWWERYRNAKNLCNSESDDDLDKILSELPESLEEENVS